MGWRPNIPSPVVVVVLVELVLDRTARDTAATALAFLELVRFVRTE